MTDTDPQPPSTRDSGMPSIGPAFLWIVTAALASAFVAIWGVQYVGQQREKTFAARVDSLRAVLAVADSLAQRAGSPAGNAVEDARESREVIDPLEIEELRRVGLADPVHDLKTDLMKHPELIPYPGVLGGTLGFYSSDDIRILGSHWAFARFKNGHIRGTILLEYQVRNGRITWKRIAAARDE